MLLTCSKFVRSRDAVPYWFLAVFALAVHGPLLLNDGVYWDGWLLFGYFLNRDWTSLYTMFREAGGPLTAHLHHILWWSPLPLIATYKIIVWSAITASTMLFYSSLIRLKVFSRREALFAAAVFCCYPAYRVQVELITMPISVAYAFVSLGAYLTLRIPSLSGRVRKACLIAAAAAFILSAQVPPFVLLIVGVSPILAWATTRRQQTSPATYPELAIVFGLPVILYGVKALLWPPYGLYAGYNNLLLDLAGGYGSFIREFISVSVFLQFTAALDALATQPILVLCLVILMGLAIIRWFPPTPDESSMRGSSAAIAFVSFGLLAVAIAPYTLVLKMMAVDGWDSRHGVLVGLPIAIGLIAAGRGLAPLRGRFVKWIGPVSAIVLTAAFTLTTWQTYAEWQVRWIKDRSIIANLKAAPRDLLDRTSYIYVEDQDLILGQKYFFYEYGGLFRLAWARESWIGNTAAELTDIPRLSRTLSARRYLFRDFAPDGCSAILRVKFNSLHKSRFGAAAKYLAFRWFDRKRLEPWLRSQTTLEWSNLSDQRIADLEEIASALRAFKSARGSFPHPDGDVARHEPGQLASSNWIAGLVPEFVSTVPVEPRMMVDQNKQYLYLSNGTDFKIINHAPEDVACVQNRRPELADPRRPAYAYGIWTEGARNW